MRSKFLLSFVLIGVSLLFGLPHLLIPLMLRGDTYSPLGGGDGPQSAIVTEEVYTYVPEAQEILEEKFPVRDTQLAEYKQTPSPFAGETFPALFMAVLSKLTGSVERAFMVSDFLFPPISVFLLYVLCRKLGVPKKFSAVAAAAAVVTTDVISLVPYPKPLWDFFVNLKGRDDFLFFSRSFHPQLSFPLFALALLVVIEALRSPRRSKTIIAGIWVGLQFYTYFFSWTAMLGTLAILVLWTIITADKKTFKCVLAVAAVAMIVGIPYIIEMQKFKFSPFYQDFFLKNTFSPRTFFPITLRYILLGTLAWKIAFSEKRSKSFISHVVLLSALASTILLPEIANLFLGRDPEAKHWVRRLLIPLSFPLAAVLADEVYRRQNWFRLKKRAASALVLIGLGVIFLFGIRVQVLASRKYAQWFHRPADKQELFDWFNLNGRDGEAVATLDSGLIAEIPAFTKLDNAVPITTRSIATTDETLERFLETAGLYRLAADDVRYLLWSGDVSVGDPIRVQELGQLLPDSKGSWVSRIFYFTANDGGQIFSLSPKKREAAVGEYRKGIGRKYRVDYIVVGPIERKLLGGEALAERYGKVFENGSYLIYKATAEK